MNKEGIRNAFRVFVLALLVRGCGKMANILVRLYRSGLLRWTLPSFARENVWEWLEQWLTSYLSHKRNRLVKAKESKIAIETAYNHEVARRIESQTGMTSNLVNVDPITEFEDKRLFVQRVADEVVNIMGSRPTVKAGYCAAHKLAYNIMRDHGHHPGLINRDMPLVIALVGASPPLEAATFQYIGSREFSQRYNVLEGRLASTNQ